MQVALRLRAMTRTGMILTALLFGLTGCADALTPEMVMSIPEGSAQGTVGSGSYALQVVTLTCEGRCMADGVALCEVGARHTETVEIRQLEGQIVMDSPEDGLEVLQGGAYQDGSFEVGAYEPGELERTAHARGSINELGELRSTILVRTVGADVDCTASVDLLGQRTE